MTPNTIGDAERLYWYDSQPHPNNPLLASTHPHHKHGSIQEMLTYAPRLVIQGQPGSGKSTLLRWLAIQIAQRTLSREQLALASWDECIPFYIQLRTFVNKPLPTPTEWPTHQVRQLALKAPDTWMHDVLTDGRAVVLDDLRPPSRTSPHHAAKPHQALPGLCRDVAAPTRCRAQGG